MKLLFGSRNIQLNLAGWARTCSIPTALLGVVFGLLLAVALPFWGCSPVTAHGTSPDPFNTLRDVTHDGGRYVAVGQGGVILTSPTGTTWSTQTSGTYAELTAITHAANQFIAVGYDGTVLTSPNGTTWTKRVSGVPRRDGGAALFLNDITYGSGHYVAVGDCDRGIDFDCSADETAIIITSPGGVRWTTRSSGLSEPLYGITYAQNQYVAVGGNGAILTSPDGVTWTKRTSGVSISLLYDITYDLNQYVIVGSGVTILTSPDGITWTRRNVNTTETHLHAVTYGSGQYVTGGSIKVFTSPDGITWTDNTDPAVGGLLGLTYSGGQYVGVHIRELIFTSSDGISWKKVHMEAEN